MHRSVAGCAAILLLAAGCGSTLAAGDGATTVAPPDAALGAPPIQAVDRPAGGLWSRPDARDTEGASSTIEVCQVAIATSGSRRRWRCRADARRTELPETDARGGGRRAGGAAALPQRRPAGRRCVAAHHRRAHPARQRPPRARRVGERAGRAVPGSRRHSTRPARVENRVRSVRAFPSRNAKAPSASRSSRATRRRTMRSSVSCLRTPTSPRSPWPAVRCAPTR